MMKRLLTAVMLFSVMAGISATSPTAQAEDVPPPNVVFIMLDDVGQGFMDAMPTVRQQIRSKGVDFTNGIVPTSLCCPSRASTLSGNYAHTTGVYTNDPSDNGGWEAFRDDESSTLATHLNDAGYRTGMVGKYLNGYPLAPTNYVPPGWDDFIAFLHPGYYNYKLRGTVQEEYGSAVADYSTDVLAKHAVQFVNSTPAETPLFLYFAPYAAHAPFNPAPRHIGMWSQERLDGAFNEQDMSDKPPWLQDLSFQNGDRIKDAVQKQHEMLMSADEGIDDIIDALGTRASNTLFVLMGDNGYLHGAHRLTGKNFPYRKSSEVPMMMRLDGVINLSTTDQVMLNIDLTATIAEVTGTTWPMDGKSYFTGARTGTVMEQKEAFSLTDGSWTHPGYCGYRTAKWLYVKWNAGYGQEMYNYNRDPYELENLVKKDRWDTKQQELKQLTKQSCSPVPPGFSWS
jgi:N-acetylglucosamine-6-sulfatase